MPFVSQKLRILIDSSPRIWTYCTEETATKVKTRGYFGPAADQLACGDWIFATTSTGGVMLHVDEIDPLELGDPR